MSKKKDLQTDIKATKKELGDASALDAMADSEGGKKLFEGFLTDIVANVETLCAKAKTMTHIEFIALGLDTKNKFDVVKAMRNAKGNRIFLSNELKKLLKQAEEMPEEEDDEG